MGCNSSFLLLLLQVQSAFIVSVGQKCALLLLLFLFRCWCSRALSATQLGSHSVAGASKHSSSRETDGQRTNALDSTRHASFSLPLLIFLLLLLVVVVVVPLLLIDESCDSPSTTIDAARALPLSNSPSLPPSSSSTHSSALPLLPLTHSACRRRRCHRPCSIPLWLALSCAKTKEGLWPSSWHWSGLLAASFFLSPHFLFADFL